HMDHIVVVMMENRSFDHVLGYRAMPPNSEGENGLTTDLVTFLSPSFSISPLSGSDITPNQAGLKTRFPVAVGHQLADVTIQLSQRLQTPTGQFINSPQGFIADFANGKLKPDDVLGYYTGEDLPMYRFLAENYSYSQSYFCAHPGPTLPNRMFSLSGDVQYD